MGKSPLIQNTAIVNPNLQHVCSKQGTLTTPYRHKTWTQKKQYVSHM